MAIQQETRQISTQPSNRLVREFRTQMSTPDMTGLSNVARTLGNIGEQEFLKSEIKDKEAGTVAGSILAKNEDGSYSRAEPPAGGSTAYRNAFNSAADAAYVNSVYRDVEAKFNVMASDVAAPSSDVLAKMQAHADGVLSGVDEKSRGLLEPIIRREFNQRQASILNRESTNARTTLIAQNNATADQHMGKYVELSTLGAGEEAQTAFGAARSAFETATRLRNPSQEYVDTELAAFDRRKSELDTFMPTFDKIRQGIANKTVAPDEVERFITMLRPGASPKGSVAFDMTDTDVANTMSKDTRDYVRGLMDTLNKNYSATLAKSTEEQKADELNGYFGAGGTSLPENIGANVHSAAARKILQAQGLTPETPDGLTALARLHNNVLPEDLYRTRFKNIHEVDATTTDGRAKLEDRLALYRRLKNLPTNEGIQDRTDILSSTERNFLYNVANSGGDNLELAARSAKALLDRGLDMDNAKRIALIQKEILVQDPNATVNERTIVGKVIDNMSQKAAGGFFKPDYKDLPMEARDFVVLEVSKSILQGIPYEQAVKDAGRDFGINWTKSNIIISNRPGGTTSPWVKKDEQIPLAYDALNQKQTDEYLRPYIDKYLKEKINLEGAKSMGVPIDTLKYGENVKLMPNRLGGAERSYTLVYYEPNARGITTLMTKENQPALIVPGGARRAFESSTTFENERRTLEARSSVGTTQFDILGQPLQKVDEGTIGRGAFEKTMSDPNLSLIEPSASYATLLNRTRTAVPESARQYVDITKAKLDEYGMQSTASFVIRTLGLESKFNPNIQNPRSTAYGLGQMTDSTWAKYGRGDRKDPEAQIDAVVRLTRDNYNSFKSTNGRPPDNGELYIMHQQGFGGANALLSNPNGNAIDVLSKVTGSRAIAVSSIANNLPPELAKYSGTMTSRQFTSYWMSKYQ